MNSENSALLALSELKNLEAMRVQKEEDDLKAREDAARRAREDAERRAREEVERREREEAERLAREHAEQEARDREERIRVQEAEARARAEGEARLKEEQLRIDAQMRMAEKKARPTWPLYVVPALVVGLGAVGYLAWNHAEQVEDASAQIAEEKKRNEEKDSALLAIQQKLDQLESEQKLLQQERSELDKKLSATQSEAEKAALLAEKAALEQKIAANEEAQRKSGSKKRSKRRSTGSDEASSDEVEAAPAAKGRKDKINLAGGDDPLSGI